MHRAEDTAAASVSRSTMCALVSCERDGVVSGQQAVQRESYGFFHLVWGEHESIWDIMLPRYDGFAKLFHYVAVGRTPLCSPMQDSTASVAFWLDYHNWMCQMAFSPGGRRLHYNDCHALPLMQVILGAVRDYLAAHPALHSFWREKIAFAETDLCRLARVCMRLHQYCLHRSGSWAIF